MRRCAIPSPARRRAGEQYSTTPGSLKISPQGLSLDNDNNISESNAINSPDELLVTNESTAAHLIFREIFDSTFSANTSKGAGDAGGGRGNLLERHRTLKNATIVKDGYSPFKSGAPYYIESRTKRPQGLMKPVKHDQLEFGQKLALKESVNDLTEKIVLLPPATPRIVTMPRNLVASHRRGMLNFKSSLLSNPLSISAIPTRSEVVPVVVEESVGKSVPIEDPRTEESRAAEMVVTVPAPIETTSTTIAPVSTHHPPPPAHPLLRRKNHGILLDLPPSTIHLDIRGSGGFEKSGGQEGDRTEAGDLGVIMETTENVIQDVEEDEELPISAIELNDALKAVTKNVQRGGGEMIGPITSSTIEKVIATTVEEISEELLVATTPQPKVIVDVVTEENLRPVVINGEEEGVIPSIGSLFPQLVEEQKEETTKIEVVTPSTTTTTTSTEAPQEVVMIKEDVPVIPRVLIKETPTTSSTTTTTSTSTSTPSPSTTERNPYKPSPSRGYKPSTPKTTTTTLRPKRLEFTPSTVDSVDFRRTTLNPIKRFSPRPKKTTTTSSTTLITTSSSSSSSTTTTTVTTPPLVDHHPVPHSSFETVFNLSTIFAKFPEVPKVNSESESMENNTLIPSPTVVVVIPEPDRVLLQPDTDVTIELQRMNMATYVLAGLGMFPIVIIILYVIKTIIYNKQLKNGPQAVPVDSFGDPKISPVVMKGGNILDGGDLTEDILKEVELTRKNLRFKSILGEGNFGQVWKAEAEDLPGHMGTTRIVAVKTERPEHGTGGLKQEAEIMYKLGSHPNVVTLLGCCVQDEPHLLIMEFAMRGRLLSLLRAARNAIHSMGGHVGTARSSSIPLSPRRLSGFAHDIARGMEYIASKNVSEKHCV